MSDRKLTTKKKSPASKNTFLGQPQLNHPAKRAREAESPIGEDPAQTSTLDILPKKAAKTQQQFSLFGLWRSASNSLKTLPLASHWAGL
jgi:hypothetical protein